MASAKEISMDANRGIIVSQPDGILTLRKNKERHFWLYSQLDLARDPLNTALHGGEPRANVANATSCTNKKPRSVAQMNVIIQSPFKFRFPSLSMGTLFSFAFCSVLKFLLQLFSPQILTSCLRLITMTCVKYILTSLLLQGENENCQHLHSRSLN